MLRPVRLAFLLLSLCWAASSFAADYYVDITNKTGHAIWYLHVSPGKAKSWEEDLLGDDVMADGERRRVTLKGYPSSIFDIRLTDEDGDTYTFWNVDVATQDLEVTLADLD